MEEEDWDVVGSPDGVRACVPTGLLATGGEVRVDHPPLLQDLQSLQTTDTD